MRLLVATRNRGKARELLRLLAGLPCAVLTPDDLGLDFEVDETGDTFEANAELKARAFAEASGLPTVADDSGLAVDALGGAPGVRSARFAGEPRDDRRNLEKLLRELAGVPDEGRTARFLCRAALAVPSQGESFAGIAPGGVRIFAGACEGRLGRTPRGSGGFGYDPVFVPDGRAETFAEMDEGEKDGLSHRGRALRALAAHLRKALADRPGDVR